MKMYKYQVIYIISKEIAFEFRLFYHIFLYTADQYLNSLKLNKIQSLIKHQRLQIEQIQQLKYLEQQEPPIMSQDFRLKLSRREENDYIKQQQSEKQKNSMTYRVELQDHTLGDLLRIFLLKNQQVKFAGYRLPHPLENVLEIKVQTYEKHPNIVVKDTLALLQKDLMQLEGQFEEALANRVDIQ